MFVVFLLHCWDRSLHLCEFGGLSTKLNSLPASRNRKKKAGCKRQQNLDFWTPWNRGQGAEDTRKRKLQNSNSLKLMRNSAKHLRFFGEGQNLPVLWDWTPCGCASGCGQYRTPQEFCTLHCSLFFTFSIVKEWMNCSLGKYWPEVLTIQVFYWSQALIFGHCRTVEVLDCPWHCPG